MSLPETTLSTGFAVGGTRIRNGLARAKDATINAANLPRLTSQQMAFVQALVDGAESFTAAYLKAYPTANKWPRHAVWASASQMAAKPKVKQWLDVAWTAQARTINRTAMGHVYRLETVFDKALEAEQFGAALGAEKAHAEALGHRNNDGEAAVQVTIRSFGNEIKDITPSAQDIEPTK